MKKTSLLILISITLSCSTKDLNRDKAKDLINEFYEFPIVEISSFPLEMSNEFNRNPKFVELNRNGYITLGKRVAYTRGQYYIRFSEIGKSYRLNSNENQRNIKVATNEIKLKEITGIVLDPMMQNIVRVEYTIERFNITPFGFALGKYQGEIINKEIIMQLYDDGWRIKKEKEKFYKSTDFAGFDTNFLKKLEEQKKKNDIIDSNQGEPDEIIGIISDPDGYTNMRESKNSSSAIIERVLENEKFLIISQEGDWWHVNVLATGNQGYIHRSRISITQE